MLSGWQCACLSEGVPNLSGTRGSVSLKTVFPWTGWGWFQDDSSALHLLYILYHYFYISSTSDHQALDPRGWEPLPELVCKQMPSRLAVTPGKTKNIWDNKQ